jgi:UDP-glucose 4-epimerase
MRYLVTGGAGFIGSHVTDALVARDHTVVVLDDLSTGRLENLAPALESGRVRFVEGSILDENLVDDCMRSVDACVDLAAAVGVQLILAHPLETLLGNLRGTRVVMESAARHGCRLLFASTSEVYGKLSGIELKEDSDLVIGDPAQSRWSYAIAKLAGEAAAHAYFQDRGAEMIVIRPFNVVGPRQTGAYGMVLPRFVGQALAGEPLTVYGDGAQSRCFTDVRDATHAILGLLAAPAVVGHVYNVGSSTQVRILDVAHRVIERCGSASPIELVSYSEAYGIGFEELGTRVPDTTALAGAIGWKPLHTLDETIDDVIAHSLAAREQEAARFEAVVMGGPLPAVAMLESA